VVSDPPVVDEIEAGDSSDASIRFVLVSVPLAMTEGNSHAVLGLKTLLYPPSKIRYVRELFKSTELFFQLGSFVGSPPLQQSLGFLLWPTISSSAAPMSSAPPRLCYDDGTC